jgi:Lon protease-like protein
MAAVVRVVPVFPLANVVLFPGVPLPLHIFEPRYRTMTAEALEQDGRIALALLRPGYEADYHGTPPVFETVGIGEIAQNQKLPDGRFHIVLRGTERGTILEETQARPYRVARVQILPERAPPDGAPDLNESLELFREVIERLGQPSRRDTEVLLREARVPGQVVDFMVSLLPFSPLEKLRYLGEPDVVTRAERLAHALRSLRPLVEPPTFDPDADPIHRVFPN